MLPDDGSMTAAGFSKVLSGPVCTGRGLHAFSCRLQRYAGI
jgi:hypothetical protein